MDPGPNKHTVKGKDYDISDWILDDIKELVLTFDNDQSPYLLKAHTNIHEVHYTMSDICFKIIQEGISGWVCT